MAIAAARPAGRRLAVAAPQHAEAQTPPSSGPSLSGRLAEARKAAEGPAARVGELEAALQDALDRQDYATAHGVKDQLAEARQEHAIAAAAVTGLQAAIADIERQAAEDARAIQMQQIRDAATRQLAEARRMEQEAMGELDAEVAAVFAGLEAVQRTIRRGLQLEQQVWQARAEAYRARVVLGEVEDGMRISAPNKLSAKVEQTPALRAVMQWHR
jgi:hypothetical protein